MNSSNTKLKPLDHKKSLNNQPNNQPITNPKVPVKKPLAQGLAEKKKVVDVPNETNSTFQKVKYTRTSSRTATKIEFYDCNDLDMPGLE